MVFDISQDSYLIRASHPEDLPPAFTPTLEACQADHDLNRHDATIQPSSLSRFLSKASPWAIYNSVRNTLRNHNPYNLRFPLPAINMAFLFDENSERGLVIPSKHTLQTGKWHEVLRNPDQLRERKVWLLESIFHYRELDIARNYTMVVPRGLGGRPIVSGKTNCIEGVKAMYEEANRYFIESWTGQQRNLIIKFRKMEPKVCHPKLPTPKVERTAEMRINELETYARTVHNLSISTIGIREQWQMFKEDIKPKADAFDLMPYRMKYFGDLDMDLKDGMIIDFSVCECNWKTPQQGRTLELMMAGKELDKTCKAVGSSLRPDCWGCVKIFQIREKVRMI